MRMKAFCIVGVLVLMVALVAPCQAGQGGLVDLLVSQLGVTQTQAEGGAGSIFKSAQKNLSVDDFSLIADVVPNMDSMLAAAPEIKSTSGTLGSVKSLLGNSDSNLGSMVGLADSFGKMGMDADMVGKFVPVVLDYVKGSGGETVMNLLKSAL